jgi:hypothetical protein
MMQQFRRGQEEADIMLKCSVAGSSVLGCKSREVIGRLSNRLPCWRHVDTTGLRECSLLQSQPYWLIFPALLHLRQLRPGLVPVASLPGQDERRPVSSNRTILRCQAPG